MHLSRSMYIILGLALLMGYSCSSYEDDWPETEELRLHPLIPVSFHQEIVETSRSHIRAKAFYIYADSILITVNKPSSEQAIVVLSQLSSGQVITRILTKGNGPGEVLDCICHMDGDILYINDFAKNKLFSLDIRHLLASSDVPDAVTVFDYRGYGPTPFVTSYDGTSVLCENPYCFKYKRLHISNGNEKRFDRFHMDQERSLKHHRYDTYNASQGMLVPLRDNNLVFYASLDRPWIELYDTLGNRKKLFTGPTKLPVEYAVHEGRIVFKDKIPYAYLGYGLSDGFIYFNYIGGYWENGYDNLHSTLLKFDRDGAYLGSLELPRYVSSFSVIHDYLIYGTGYDEHGETILWKFFIP